MSYNYESIPADTRSAIDNVLNLDNDTKKAMAKLWRLYLRLYEHDSDQSIEEMETFIQELYNMSNHTQESMLNAINQKINDLEREINGNDFNGRGGIKKRKTGKKRKRTTKKTSKKRRRRNTNKRRL